MKKYFFLLSACWSSFAEASFFEHGMSHGNKLTIPPVERLEDAQEFDVNIWLALDDPETSPPSPQQIMPIGQTDASEKLCPFSVLVGHVLSLPSVEGLEDSDDSHLDAFEALVEHALTLSLNEIVEDDEDLHPETFEPLAEAEHTLPLYTKGKRSAVKRGPDIIHQPLQEIVSIDTDQLSQNIHAYVAANAPKTNQEWENCMEKIYTDTGVPRDHASGFTYRKALEKLEKASEGTSFKTTVHALINAHKRIKTAPEGQLSITATSFSTDALLAQIDEISASSTYDLSYKKNVARVLCEAKVSAGSMYCRMKRRTEKTKRNWHEERPFFTKALLSLVAEDKAVKKQTNIKAPRSFQKSYRNTISTDELLTWCDEKWCDTHMTEEARDEMTQKLLWELATTHHLSMSAIQGRLKRFRLIHGNDQTLWTDQRERLHRTAIYLCK